MNESQRPYVAVTILIRNDHLHNDLILFGKRINAHGHGTWAPPAGHLEFKENVFECAMREVLEEVGITIKNLTIGPYTNDYYADINKHYINLHIIADYDSGDVQILEPDKCETWQWTSWKNLPTPLSISVQNLLQIDFDPFN